jgi:hypothetical protein
MLAAGQQSDPTFVGSDPDVGQRRRQRVALRSVVTLEVGRVVDYRRA